MLYDKRWDERKQTIFSLDALIDWLRQQYAEDEYCFIDNGGCMLARYFRDCGKESVIVGGEKTWLDGIETTMPESFRQISVGSPRTYGAALERAIAFKATMETTHA